MVQNRYTVTMEKYHVIVRHLSNSVITSDLQ